MLGNVPVNIGDQSIAPPMQPIDPSSIPDLPKKRGMFGGVTINPGNAIAGFMAGMYPQYAEAFLAPQMQRDRIQGEMQAQANLQTLEFQRQLALAQEAAKLKLQFPDSPLAQSLYQAGIMPGTPQWTQAMQTSAQNSLDPVVNAGPWGPVLRSQVAGAASAKPLTDADIEKMSGGPTPSASGGFR